MMKEMYRIKALPFLLWWIACSIFVWPLSLILMGIIFVPVALIVQSIFPSAYYGNGFDSVMGFVGVPLLGAILGLTVASLQRRLLRNRLYWAADNWRKWSMIGGVLGAYAVYGISFLLNAILSYPVSDVWVPFAMMPVFVLVVSAFQWLTLRHAVKQAWLWILGNGIAGMVFSGLVIRNQPDPYADTGLPVVFLFALAVVAQGFITGYVLLFLFEKKLLPMSPDGREDEEVEDEKHPKSVWDEAI